MIFYSPAKYQIISRGTHSADKTTDWGSIPHTSTYLKQMPKGICFDFCISIKNRSLTRGRLLYHWYHRAVAFSPACWNYLRAVYQSHA